MMFFAYDIAGRLTTGVDTSSYKVSVSFNHVVYTYDVAGRKTRVSTNIDGWSDFTNDYTYDNLNRVTRIEQYGTDGNPVDEKRVDIEYNALGQVTTAAGYNSLAADEGDLVWVALSYYDGANRLGAVDQYAAGVTPLSETLYRDVAGRITRQWFDGHVSDFSYDNDGQLTGVSDVSGQTPLVPAESLAYTANGNRDQTGFTTAGDNELTQAPAPTGGYHYEYAFDAEGNRTDRYLRNSSGSTFEYVHYVWDYRDRLREAPGTTMLPAKYVMPAEV